MTQSRYQRLELDSFLNDEISVLDHGFVRLIDYMGGDESIVQAARVSYGEGTKTVREDRGLIRYLLRHRHTTPFEMCEIKLHIRAPIFVARQWLRHRTASVNEYSARYSVVPENYYVPSLDQLSSQSSLNKQVRSDELLPLEERESIRSQLNQTAQDAFSHYQDFLKSGDSYTESQKNSGGLSRELARIVLPQSTYTEFYWKINLHNLLHFLSLRLEKDAQYEIRVFAEAIATIVKTWVPLSWEAFQDYRLNSVEFSGPEIAILKQMLQRISSQDKDANLFFGVSEELLARLSKREQRDLEALLLE